MALWLRQGTASVPVKLIILISVVKINCNIYIQAYESANKNVKHSQYRTPTYQVYALCLRLFNLIFMNMNR